MYTKPCKQCLTLFNDTSNNQKKYCSKCMLERRKQTYKKQQVKQGEARGKPDHNKIQCLICHKYYRKPMSHAWQAYGTTAREYKDNYQLEQKGLIPEHDREILRKHAEDNYDLVVKRNLIDNPKSHNTRFQKDHNKNYKRKPITLERLRKHALTLTKVNQSSPNKTK